MIESIKLRSPYTRNLEKYLQKEFGSNDTNTNKIKLSDYIEFGKVQSQDAFALIRNGEISTIIAIKISTFEEVINYNKIIVYNDINCKKLDKTEKCLFIEFFTRNSKIHQQQTNGDGIIMINELKGQCQKLNIKLIALEADGINPEELAKSYYVQKLGFIRCSDKYHTGDWPGELIFMVCDLR